MPAPPPAPDGRDAPVDPPPTTPGPPAMPEATSLAIPVKVELSPEAWKDLTTFEGTRGRAAPDGERRAAAGEADREPDLVPGGAAGRYVVLEEIGRGGMGVVHRAFDRDLRRYVAMKVMRLRFGPEREVAERFVEEAQATAQLQHPGIVPVYEIGLTPDGRLFFTMKLVRGRTLAEALLARRAGDAAAREELSLFRLLEVFVEVARTVAYAHARGVVHRDLKPENVMLGPFGEVQVMDWGIAKVLGRAPAEGGAAPGPGPGPAGAEPEGPRLDARPETEAGVVFGTPAYMAPEQASGRARPPADVYSLGGILYCLLTGRPPYEGPSAEIILKLRKGLPPPRPRALDPGIPRELEAACLKALARAPEERYATAGALADDVQAWLEGRPVGAYPEGSIGRAVRFARRHRTIAATVAAAFVLGLVVTIVALVRIAAARRDERAARLVADLQRARAEARERDAAASLAIARLSLAGVLTERARAALAARDVLVAEILLAGALARHDERETRERLLEARAQGVRILLARRHGGVVHDVAFAADARRVASASEDGTAAVFDLETGGTTWLRGHGKGVRAVAFTPDGRRLVSAGDDGTVRLWDVERGQELRAFRDQAGPVLAVAVGPDGQRIASGGEDRKIRVRDADFGAEPLVLGGHEAEVVALEFSPDGRRLASTSRDGTVRLWEPVAGKAIRVLRRGEPPGPPLRPATPIRDLAYLGAGAELVAAGEDDRLSVWSVDLALEGLVFDVGVPLRRVAASRSRSLAWVRQDGDVGFRRLTGDEDPGGGAPAPDLTLGGAAGGVESIALDADGRRLALGGRDGRVRVLALDDRAEVAAIEDRTSVRGLALLDGGRRIAAVGGGPTLRVFDVSTRERILAVDGHEGRGTCIAASPDGRRLATGAVDRTVRIHEVEPGATAVRPLREIGGFAKNVLGVAFFPDGRRLAVGVGDGTARVVDVETGEEAIRRLDPEPHPDHAHPVFAVVPVGDGRRLAAGWHDAWVRDLETGAETALRAHEARVLSVAASPDGRRLVTGAEDGRVRVFDLDDREPVRVLPACVSGVRRLAFAPDGRRLAAAELETGAVRIFDLDAGALAVALRGHEGHVHGVAFDPSGRRLFSAGEDRRIAIWSLDAVERVLRAPPADLLAESERATGLRIDDDGLEVEAAE